MKKLSFYTLIFCISVVSATMTLAQGKIVHEAEYYILEVQNGQKWAVEDGELDKKLAELKKKYKSPPNIIHYM